MTVDLGIVVIKIREYILSRGFIYLLCLSITLVYLVVVHFLMCLLIHIWILLFMIVGRGRFQLSVERSGERKGYNQSECPFCVRIAFDGSVCAYIVKLCRLSHVGHGVNLSSIVGHVKYEADYLLKRGVSWLILVKLITPVCSARLRFTVCFPLGLTTQTVQDYALPFVFQSDLRLGRNLSCR